MTLKNIASRCEKSVIIKPETKTVEESNKLRLTLPDYKLSIGINIDEHIYEDINIDNNCKENLNNDTKTQLSMNIINNKADKNNANEDSKGDSTKNICTICRKSFISKKWFLKHMEKEHSGQKYTCTYCPKCMFLYL